jgi:DNA-binding transcriptional ArsR family regulator
MEQLAGLETQIVDLTARVQALESRPPKHEPSASSDPLWILDGIKERVDDPGAVFFAGVVRTTAGPVEWQTGYPVDQVLASDWGMLAQSLASLGNPVRLRLLQAVISGATTVGDLSAGKRMGTTGQLYHHLNQLVAQGWLEQAGRGRYTLPAQRVVPLLVLLTAAGKHP